MKKYKYKIWLHLEQIPFDAMAEDVQDEDYKSLDDEFLPLPIQEFQKKEEAIDLMQHLHDQYYYNEW